MVTVNLRENPIREIILANLQTGTAKDAKARPDASGKPKGKK